MTLRMTMAFLIALTAWGKPATMRLQSGYVFVEAMVNGAGPFRMLVDTGADSCALTPKAAQKAGLKLNGRVQVATVTGNSTVAVSTENAVEIGGIARGHVEFGVSQLEGIKQLDSSVDGVLGQSFLRQTPYLIDYRAKMLWFGEDAMLRSAGIGEVVPSEAGAMQTMVRVAIGPEKKVRRLMLDSGASDLILECAAECPKLSQVESVEVRTNQGVGQIRRGVLSTIEIGGAVLRSRTTALRSPAGGECDGLLPASWFAAVYVNSDRNEVRFRTR